jgi:hypothetical protein
MESKGESIRKTSTGLVQRQLRYQPKNCSGCPLASACKTGTGNKVLKINGRLLELKEKSKGTTHLRVGNPEKETAGN